MRRLRYLYFVLVMLFNLSACSLVATDESLYPIHDSHIHYDQDVWDLLPTADAVNMLRQENIKRALVSATPTEGAEMLYRAAPELVIPMLRPYNSWRHRYFWFKDPELKAYLLHHLERVPYRGFGEFHVFGQDVESPPVLEMIELARDRSLALHAHTDLEGMRILLSTASDVVVIWAHGGFDVPIEVLGELLKTYPKLFIELSLREGMLDDKQLLTTQWKQLLINQHPRFLVGMDTYKPSRWADLPETVAATRHWLGQLPDNVVVAISRDNLDRVFPREK